MLYREIIAVCFEIHTKHINTLCGQKVELLNFKAGGTYIQYVLGFKKLRSVLKKCVNCIQLAQARAKSLAVSQTVVKIRVPLSEEFLDELRYTSLG
jgi:hypothetical protein